MHFLSFNNTHFFAIFVYIDSKCWNSFLTILNRVIMNEIFPKNIFSYIYMCAIEYIIYTIILYIIFILKLKL